MIRSAIAIAIAALSFAVMDASAAEVKVAYKGVVTGASGPHASTFVRGQAITVHYVVETSTPDSNANPNLGVYHNGLREMKLSIPDAGVVAVTGSGTVQTFNDVGSDQVFFYSYAASGELAGQPVTSGWVDFIDWEVGLDGKAAMLVSDSIPTTPLVGNQSTAGFGTRSGTTWVSFLAEPEATCAGDGFTGTQLTWCQNICENGYSGTTLALWIHRWIARYRTLPTCALSAPVN